MTRPLLRLALSSSLLFVAVSCSPATPPTTCSADTCGGCCTSDGRCEAGDSTSACGKGGSACAACAADQSCGADGTCGGGLGGGSGGGAGGGTGGGGGDDAGMGGGTGGGGGDDAGMGGGTGGGGDDGGAGGGSGGGTGGGAGGGGGDPSAKCMAATTVTLAANGLGTAMGTTSGTMDDLAATCGGTGSGDVAFKVTTPSSGTLQVEVVPAMGSTLKPVVSVRSACAVANSQVANGCAAATATGSSAVVTLTQLAAGDWYILVDGADAGSGAFTLNVSFSTTAGATCLTATSIDAAKTAPLTIAGTTVGMPAAFGGTCAGGGATATEVIYTFTTTDVRDLRVEVQATSSAYQPAIYLRSSCMGATTNCVQAAAAGGRASLQVGNLPAGTYFVFVDGAANTQGTYTMTASILPPPAGDTCTNPPALAFDGGVAVVSDDTTRFNNDFGGSCLGGNTGGDAIYSFTTTATYDIRAVVESTTDGGYAPAVYLRQPCNAGNDFACGTAGMGTSATAAAGGRAPGTYFVFVDGTNRSSGPFRLTTTLTTPAAGDVCTTAAPLTLNMMGQATVTGDTTLLFNDQGTNCTPGGSGPEIFYAVTVTQVSDLTATVTPTSMGYQPVVAIRNGCGGGGELTCTAASAAGTSATARRGSLQPGTYYVAVDGVQGSAGGFSLDVRLTPPGAGDTCANPVPLMLSLGADGGTAMVSGSTAAAFNDQSSTCAAAGSGPDTIYSFTTAQVLDLRATLTPDAGYTGLLSLRATCTGNELTCTGGGAAGQALNLSRGSLAAGTYFLTVDGLQGSAGGYDLAVSLQPPVAGDTCASGPIPLTIDPMTGGMANVSGSTTSVFNDFGSACSGSGSGPDMLYTFTIGTAMNLSASVTPSMGSATYQPLISLRSTCSNTETTCAAAGMAGGVAGIANRPLTAGTYFLFVDGVNQTAGDYALQVALAPPPQGDTCTNPIDLTFSGTSASATGNTALMASNGVPGTCQSAGGAPDAVYRFTLATPARVTATVTPPMGSTYRPIVALQTAATCGGNNSLQCNAAGAAGSAATFTTAANLAAGTYYLFVDGVGGTGGPFTLDVTLQ